MERRKDLVLVAGGAGFIGSHLCVRLLSENKKVICIDNLQTGCINNIQFLMTNHDFEFVNHDIVLPYLYNGEAPIREIYNLACPASPVHYQETPIHTTETCVIGTLNLLRLAQRYSCKYLQASTSEVYGEPDFEHHPQIESYRGNVNNIGVRSCYDEGKRCAESLCMDFYRQYSVPVKIIRIFNTYGPNMSPDDGRVISNFILQALKGESITIYGDGTQTRSFQYVYDLIEGVIKMMQTEADFTGPVNLGNPEEYTIKGLADKILSLTKSKSEIIYKSLPLDDPIRRQPDITLAKSVLSWSPKVCVNDGLIKTINSFIDKFK